MHSTNILDILFGNIMIIYLLIDYGAYYYIFRYLAPVLSFRVFTLLAQSCHLKHNLPRLLHILPMLIFFVHFHSLHIASPIVTASVPVIPLHYLEDYILIDGEPVPLHYTMVYMQRKVFGETVFELFLDERFAI